MKDTTILDHNKVNDLPEISRVEVITEDGRDLVTGATNVQVSIQDDGRTMKVFLRKAPYPRS